MKDKDTLHSSRRKNRNVLPFLAAILVLVAGCAGICYMTGLFRMPEEPVVVEKSDVVFVSSQISVSESSAEESKLQFDPAGTFQYDFNTLSLTVRKNLIKNVTSQYVVLYDVTSDKVLFQKNCTKKCYPASTTKMLTAIVACRIIDPDTVLTVGNEIRLIGEESSRAGLLVGMKFPFRALLDALLLPSGNDAAYTIAVNAARIYRNDQTLSDQEALKVFVDLMNEAAADLGCEDTHFVNPDGWHDDDHYTTALDLIKIAASAVKVPLIKESCRKTYAKWDIVQDIPEESSAPESKASSASSPDSKPVKETSQADSKPAKETSQTASKPAKEPSQTASKPAKETSRTESKASTTAASPQTSVEVQEEPDPLIYDPKTFGTVIEWYTSNSMLYEGSGMYSPYADGVKTGFTDEAGTSVIASATMNGHMFLAAAMDGKNVYEKYHDVHMLFTEGFKLYKLKYTYDS